MNTECASNCVFEWWRSHRDRRFFFIGMMGSARTCFGSVENNIEGRAVVDDFGDLVRVSA